MNMVAMTQMFKNPFSIPAHPVQGSEGLQAIPAQHWTRGGVLDIPCTASHRHNTHFHIQIWLIYVLSNKFLSQTSSAYRKSCPISVCFLFYIDMMH